MTGRSDGLTPRQVEATIEKGEGGKNNIQGDGKRMRLRNERKFA